MFQVEFPSDAASPCLAAHLCAWCHLPRVPDNATGKVYIMMEARLGGLFKAEGEYTILDK